MSNYDIYGIGAGLVDTEIEVSDKDLESLAIEKGVMTLVDEERQHALIDALSTHLVASNRASGGSAANSIIAASYFGARNFYSCRVASDENGAFYLKDLANAGVDYHNRNGSCDGITGKCLVMITPDAERTMNTFLGTSEYISAEDIDLEALCKSRYAYIEGYLVTSETGRPAAIALREQAEANNVKTALSLSDPAIVNFFRDGLLEMVGSGVDIMFCNEDEAINFTQTANVKDAAEALKQYAKTFAITRGSDGALLFDGTEYVEVSAHKVQPLDTNGAGDMFAGAFLFGITRGMDFASAGALASKAASVVVSQFGPRLSQAQHAELLASLA
ncbi:adenosine kinase [Teredinibacter purpureus]|jgi:Sugar kinases, ribokinase family|uniref:adenosine kinase n=1 Tax=Teredinibacter purpureus TaxID=2731756 RepID=UPI0005F822B0|nr:adenosine kinase [Teredinibacter purpureus]